MFVIGTAGHIDHGKSSLIIRLTGIDPDRLPEEKQRGMTIDLGFAWYDTEGGKRIGIVDVPGHERFVRNMIAGAGGIDAVILVVAADDGWMPQSQEHLQITRLLGIKCGIVAISKIDLVEKSWVDLVEEDLRDKLRGTFLENAPLVKLSSVTGEGIEELRDEIEILAKKIVEREDIGRPRLYVDRSFVLSGMGGVATGTLRDGLLKVGQEVAVFPAKRHGKIRTLHSHNQQVDIASPGQRTAVSLTGIDKEYLIRGGVISLPNLVDNFHTEGALALSVSLIPESAVSLEDRRRVLLILGTTEVEGEVRLYDTRAIPPGGQGIVFFRPYAPLFSFIGDRFILRLPTPQVTVGGGLVLDMIKQQPRRKDIDQFRYLEKRKILSPESLVLSALEHSLFIDNVKDFLYCNFRQEIIEASIAATVQKGEMAIHGGKYYRPDIITRIIEGIISGMKSALEIRPHIDGLSSDEIARLAGRSIPSLEPILDLMCEKGLLAKKKNRFDLAGRAPTVKGELKAAADHISRTLLDAGFSPPTIEELIGGNSLRKEAFDYLLLTGEAVKIGGGLAFHFEKWESIIRIIRGMLDAGETLSVAALREKLDSSRKYTVPILEETDRLKITARQGDVRIKGERYEKG